jgi:hypothetical protein
MELKNGMMKMETSIETMDLPAVEYANGDKEWWRRGRRHRDDGPAIIYEEKEY